MSASNGRAKQSAPYIVIAIVIVSLAAMGGAGALLLTQGAEGLVAAAVITTFATTIISTLVGLQAKQTHDLVNSTAAENRVLTRELATAQGIVIGAAQEAALPQREVPAVTTLRQNIKEVRTSDPPPVASRDAS